MIVKVAMGGSESESGAVESVSIAKTAADDAADDDSAGAGGLSVGYLDINCDNSSECDLPCSSNNPVSAPLSIDDEVEAAKAGLD